MLSVATPISNRQRRQNAKQQTRASSETSCWNLLSHTSVNGAEYIDRFGTSHPLLDLTLQSEIPTLPKGPPPLPEALETPSSASRPPSGNTANRKDQREICRNFLNGICRHGRCPRIHPPPETSSNTSTQQTNEPLLNPAQNTVPLEPTCPDLPTPTSIHPHVEPSPTPIRTEAAQEQDICINHLINQCLWGRRCRRRHITRAELDRLNALPDEGQSARYQKFDEICKLYLENRCTLGRFCRRTHPAPDKPDATGATIHSAINSNPETVLEKPPVAITTADEPKVDKIAESIDPSPTPTSVEPVRQKEVCRRYLQGRCPPGRRCTRTHPPPKENDPPSPPKVGEVPRVTKKARGNGSPSPPKVDEVSRVTKEAPNDAVIPASAPAVLTVQLPAAAEKEQARKKRKKPSKTAGQNQPTQIIDNVRIVGEPVIDGINPVEEPVEEYHVKLPSPRGSSGKKPEHTVNSSPLEWDSYREASWWADDSSSNADNSSDTSANNSSGTFSSILTEPMISSSSHTSEASEASTSAERRPRSPQPDICRNWLKGYCPYSRCIYRHTRLDSDYRQVQRSVLRPTPPHLTPSTPPSDLTVTVLDHTTVTLGAGFEIRDVTTGFESRWIMLGKIPSTVSEEDIRSALEPFGQIIKVSGRLNTWSSPVDIKVQFSKPSEAMQAAATLNGSHLWGNKLSARLPVNSESHGTGIFNDTCVHLSWKAPTRKGYAGYSSLAQAQAAVVAASQDPTITASIYEGVPAVGSFNVQFQGLPPQATAKSLERFGSSESIMLGQPNYNSLDLAVKIIRSILEQSGELVTFDILPAPYKDGKVRGWAYFVSSDDAKQAYTSLNNHKLNFLGNGKTYAWHHQTVSYSLPPHVYDRVASEVKALREMTWRRGPNGATIAIVDKRVSKEVPSPTRIKVKISGENIRDVGCLKSAFEKTLRGEVLRQDGKIAWDGFFGRLAGERYLRDVEQSLGISIQRDIGRHTITLFGPQAKRDRGRKIILEFIDRQRKQQRRPIRLTGSILALFMSEDLISLQREYGAENIVMDLLERQLVVRGPDSVYEAAQRAVRDMQEHHHCNRNRSIHDCPVCFSPASSPVTMQCGHTWCRSCLSNYLVAATDNKLFPLTCLGAEANCSKPISLSTAQDVLTAAEFDAVVQASFLVYIRTRPNEFHHCPTSDCPQVYRSAPRDAVLQCPSCLVRICPKCHVECHDGAECGKDGEDLFKEWAQKHDVKSCPGCKAPIERSEGCNHMTCIRCQTHICWVCLRTFPKGEGIYKHMRDEHGGIGI